MEVIPSANLPLRGFDKPTILPGYPMSERKVCDRTGLARVLVALTGIEPVFED